MTDSTIPILPSVKKSYTILRATLVAESVSVPLKLSSSIPVSVGTGKLKDRPGSLFQPGPGPGPGSAKSAGTGILPGPGL